MATDPASTPVAASTSTASPTPCEFFAQMYPVSESSFVTHKATLAERKVIEHWYATVSKSEQNEVRWMRSDGILGPLTVLALARAAAGPLAPGLVNAH